MKLYREVKASEKLPQKIGFYLADEIDEEDDKMMMMPRLFDPKRPSSFYNVEHWLEPIEITEEEIRRILDFACCPQAENITKAILSKLKGE